MSLNPCSLIFAVLERGNQNLHAGDEMDNENEY